MSTKTVLVVGGSATGIQLALEEAEKGNEVYLVEEVPLLRTTGIVADGDVLKTSQLLAELEKRRDKVHVIAPADLVRVAQGKNGQFKVKARKKATGVMPERCNSCEDCVLACPVIMEDPYRNRLPSRTAIDSLNPGCGGYHIVKEAPPCQEACPVHLDVRGYVGYIADGKYRKSLDLIREHLPFPGIIGRICTRPCENVCNRGMADESIAICALKRFVADRELEREVIHDGIVEGTRELSGKRVAIVGSGPAGLTCAYELARMGHEVVVFESLPVVGGMLRVGIPEYRLPREILEVETALVERRGVRIRTNITVGKDVTLESLHKEYQAVFIAVGAHKSLALNIPGTEGTGVYYGVDFLRRMNLGEDVVVGEKVVVVGGGDVAVDSARSALRMGAKEVSVVYRRTKIEMPAHDMEIEAALAEGIEIRYLVAPKEILLEDGRVKGLRCVRMELGTLDDTGRRTPVPVGGSEFDMELDMVIPAVGQVVDADLLSWEDGETKGGRLLVAPDSMITAHDGVFAGGDAVTGPRNAIEAIAAGKEAAASINNYLGGL